MKLDIIMQTEEVNLKKIIENEMETAQKKMYVFSGVVKESGFNILEENIIDKKTKLLMYMGIDKKNTTKSLLETILSYTDELYVYNNNDMKELEGCIIVFESDKRAAMYVTSSKISENSLLEDLVVISKISYDLTEETDKRDYKEKIKELSNIKEMGFTKISKSDISKLMEDKVIFSNKQYEHNVKSIAELLGKSENNKENVKINSEEDIDGKEFDIPTLDLNTSLDEFEIDISEVNETKPEKEKIVDTITEEKKVEKTKKKKEKSQVEKEEEFEDYLKEDIEDDSNVDTDGVIDLDSALLIKSKIKLKEKKEIKVEEEKEKEKQIDEYSDAEVVKTKKVDLNNVTNFIMELPAKQQNKKDLDIIKIPNYIRDLIPNFFEFPDKSKTVNEGGITVKERPVNIEIVDCKNNKKYVQNSSKIFQKKGQTYLSIKCDDLENIPYEENDIVRIIKLSSDIYHIEVVSKDMQEYKIWSKIMNKNLRASSRKYGIM